MLKLQMTVARVRSLIAGYGGKITGIQTELTKAGFDIDREWTKDRDKKTGDHIFLQEGPVKKPKKKAVKKVEPAKVPAKKASKAEIVQLVNKFKKGKKKKKGNK